MRKVLINGRVFIAGKFVDGLVIIIQNGIITSVQKEIPPDTFIIDLEGNNIAPGFIDIQINGGEKLYFTQNITELALHDICDASLQFGTTHTLPCLISSPKEKSLKIIKNNIRNIFFTCQLHLISDSFLYTPPTVSLVLTYEPIYLSPLLEKPYNGN
jgi:N-acetylglucosamine-6-phosphate deacetylase